MNIRILLLLIAYFGVTSTFNQSIYTQEGDTSLLQCPIERLRREIYSVRWTHYSYDDQFISQLHEDGSQTSPYGRFYINKSSPMTLVIEGIEWFDKGTYRCQVVYFGESMPTVGYVNVTVYAPFALNLTVSGDVGEYGWNESQLQMNRTVDTIFQVGCVAYMTRPSVHLQWTINGTNVNKKYISERKTFTETHGNRYFTVIANITINKTREEHSGKYECSAYYGDFPVDGKRQTLQLSVRSFPGRVQQTPKDTDVTPGMTRVTVTATLEDNDMHPVEIVSQETKLPRTTEKMLPDDIYILITLTNQKLNYGDTAKLVCNSSIRFSHTWMYKRTRLQNDGKYFIATDDEQISVLTISDIQTEDVGQYFCIVGSDSGISFRSNINITVKEATTEVTQMAFSAHNDSIQNDYVSILQDPLSAQSVLLKDSEKHLLYPIYFLSGMLAVVVVFLLVTVIRRNMHYRNNSAADIERTDEETSNEDISLSGSSSAPESSIHLLTSGYIHGSFDTTIDIEYHQLRFSEDNILGRGEFGVVRRASVENANHMSGHKEVAVKCPKENASIDDQEDLLQELDILKSLQCGHPNIITLLGWSTQDPIYIILELAPYGSLHDYLIANRAWELYENIHPYSRDMTSSDLLQFAWQIAKGMSFIASKKFIHRDLATRNVLVGHERCCKISDFGLSRRVSDSFVEQRTTQIRLPIRWMALESLLSSTYTTESDIWSYGVVLWEIVTLGSTPYAGIPASRVIQKLKCGYRLPKPNHCSNECYQIMSACWQQQPEARPTFSDICLKVGHLASDDTQEHLEMECFDDRIYFNIAPENWPSGERL